jgi:DNA-binding transcriptional regulator GbsR (MarR family)
MIDANQTHMQDATDESATGSIDELLWQFVSASGELFSKSYGLPPMTGRVFGWMLVCDPPEQTAAQIVEALGASKGAVSTATGMLVRFRFVERLRVRGERADRFRLRPGVWDDQIVDQGAGAARALIALGLKALADAPVARRARLEELDAFYDWWLGRTPALIEEWQEYKRTNLKGGPYV